MPSPPRFWPPRGEFPSAPLLGATHHGLGAFCTEKGVISGVLGCPEEVAALRLGRGEEEKVGGNGKTPGGSPRSSCHAESSPERKFLRNVGAASSREPGPAHRTFACLTPPPHLTEPLLGPCVCDPAAATLGAGPSRVPQPQLWVGRELRAARGPWSHHITSVTPSTLRKVLRLSLLLLGTWVDRGGEG